MANHPLYNKACYCNRSYSQGMTSNGFAVKSGEKVGHDEMAGLG